jgi:hypothetical protein
MDFNWKSIVGTVAPGLATALGGPLAGMAVKAVSGAVLGKQDGTEDEIAQAITAGGTDVLQKLRAADQAFQLDMKKLDINLEKLFADDRADARKREISTGDHTQRNLAYIALLMFATVLGVELFVGIHPTLSIDDAVQRSLDITTGILFAWVMAVKDYYFGSSSGSVAKTKSMDAYLNKG